MNSLEKEEFERLLKSSENQELSLTKEELAILKEYEIENEEQEEDLNEKTWEFDDVEESDISNEEQEILDQFAGIDHDDLVTQNPYDSIAMHMGNVQPEMLDHSPRKTKNEVNQLLTAVDTAKQQQNVKFQSITREGSRQQKIDSGKIRTSRKKNQKQIIRGFDSDGRSITGSRS